MSSELLIQVAKFTPLIVITSIIISFLAPTRPVTCYSDASAALFWWPVPGVSWWPLALVTRGGRWDTQWSPGARSPDPATEQRPEEHRAGISTRCGAAPLPHSVRDLSRDQSIARHRQEITETRAEWHVNTHQSACFPGDTEGMSSVDRIHVALASQQCCHLMAGPC